MEIRDLLNDIFGKGFQLPNIDWGILSEASSVNKATKNAIIRFADKYEKSLNFIIEGSTGNFMYKKDKRVCVDLCYEGEFFGDYSALLTGEISPIEIVALEQLTYLSIPFGQLLEFYEKQDPVLMEQVGRRSAEHLYLLKNQQLIDLQALSAEERFLKLKVKYPDILQRTASKHIASYLGITPESFSRIKKNCL